MTINNWFHINNFSLITLDLYPRTTTSDHYWNYSQARNRCNKWSCGRAITEAKNKNNFTAWRVVYRNLHWSWRHILSTHTPLPDLIGNFLDCLPYILYDVSSDNLLLNQQIIPSLFSPLVCLILYWYCEENSFLVTQGSERVKRSTHWQNVRGQSRTQAVFPPRLAKLLVYTLSFPRAL